MILLAHILIALASVGIASLTYFKPTTARLGASYGLILATIASGTVLIVTSPATLLHACVSGLLYVTVISIMTIATHARVRKLAKEQP